MHAKEILPHRRHPFRRDHCSMDVVPVGVMEPLDRELFELVFGDHVKNQIISVPPY